MRLSKLNRFRDHRYGLMAIAMVASALTAPVMAAPAVAPVAEVQYFVDAVQWEPNRPYQGIRLSVSRPDGEVVSSYFQRGETPFFEAIGDDGSYRYELRARPVVPAKVRAAAAAQRQRDGVGDERALRSHVTLPREALVQSGSFRVSGGAVVDPNVTE